MADDQNTLDIPGAAILFIDRASEEVYGSNEFALSLLGQSRTGILGRLWWEVLGVSHDPASALSQAISAGARVTFAPTLLHRGRAEEMVAGGYLVPQNTPGRSAMALLLFKLASVDDAILSAALAPSDVVAVLGVDRLDSTTRWQPHELERLMIDLRFGLLQIVPSRQDVGLPVAANIPLVMRSVTVEQGVDIGRALLSHLSPLLSGKARVRIGIAQCKPGETTLAAAVAANNAMLGLYQSAAGDLIAVASDPEPSVAGGAAMGAQGMFSDCVSAAQERAYLLALTTVVAQPHDAAAYLADIVELTLRQQGVSAVALYRRLYDDSFEFAAGGLAGETGLNAVGENRLPKAIRQLARKLRAEEPGNQHGVLFSASPTAIFPLSLHERLLGYIVLDRRQPLQGESTPFVPGVQALRYLATEIAGLSGWRPAGDESGRQPVIPLPVDDRIEGYVGDNMEGAIDQAVFLSRVDVPVAVVGPRGTGKLYVAKVIHQESGGAPDALVSIDCRAFRSRKDALARIARELERCEGKTLVFKSPHLMNPDAQLKLARQLSSRVLADTSPPRYLPRARFIALFPDSLEHLVRHGGLDGRLASVFAAYPVRVPPIRDRQRAVLRWAHKLLAQEADRRDRKVTGFTPDAEQAMLQHDWPGNISEMRQCIVEAMDKTDKEWITPVDLGIFKGLSPTGRPGSPVKKAFLQVAVEDPHEKPDYLPTSIDELGVALGEALHNLLALDSIKPLGAWLDDEVILAACERYRDNLRSAAGFLQTQPRNIGRWMPKILARDHERSSSSLWQTPRRLIKQWVMETPVSESPPLQLVQEILLRHVIRQCGTVSVADKAKIMGVSTPTYQKRLQEVKEDD